MWNAGALLADVAVPSSQRARQQAEQFIRADARQHLPAWECLESAS